MDDWSLYLWVTQTTHSNQAIYFVMDMIRDALESKREKQYVVLPRRRREYGAQELCLPCQL